jgi:hypothetical protein
MFYSEAATNCAKCMEEPLSGCHIHGSGGSNRILRETLMLHCPLKSSPKYQIQEQLDNPSTEQFKP